MLRNYKISIIDKIPEMHCVGHICNTMGIPLGGTQAYVSGPATSITRFLLEEMLLQFRSRLNTVLFREAYHLNRPNAFVMTYVTKECYINDAAIIYFVLPSNFFYSSY